MLAPQTTEPERSILGILSQLARLTHVQSNLDHKDRAQYIAFEQWLASMEQHIAAYLAKALTIGRRSHIELIREASCIAGSIYTQLQFRDAQPGSLSLQLLKNRLLSIFAYLDTENIAPDRLQFEGPFLLWILFCGGILCMNGDERAFFVERIVGLMVLLGMKGWEEMNGILRGYLWTGKLGGWTCLVLWDEVEMTRYPLGLINAREGGE
ncbi:hypothetical protein N431DRAFT_143607 [Stipitochalara longipes BDJ]|nr:hypothetical protein N431DRAFT_143607 [Stipitochalara longipes BDJ]